MKEYIDGICHQLSACIYNILSTSRYSSNSPAETAPPSTAAAATAAAVALQISQKLTETIKHIPKC
jgi:hypothetical protein